MIRRQVHNHVHAQSDASSAAISSVGPRTAIGGGPGGELHMTKAAVAAVQAAYVPHGSRGHNRQGRADAQGPEGRPGLPASDGFGRATYPNTRGIRTLPLPLPPHYVDRPDTPFFDNSENGVDASLWVHRRGVDFAVV